MIARIAAALLCAGIAGCAPLDRLEGKSPGQAHAENLALLTIAAPPAIVTPAPIVAPTPPPAMPVCRRVSGVLTCI